MKFCIPFVLVLCIHYCLCLHDRVKEALQKKSERVVRKRNSFKAAIGLDPITTTTAASPPGCASTPSRRNKQLHFRHCLLFLYDKNPTISGNDASKELASVYGEEAPKKWVCSKWLGRFRDGDKGLDDLEDEPRSGRPSEIDEDRLRSIVEEDPKTTSRELALLFNCSHVTILNHLHAIGKVGFRADFSITAIAMESFQVNKLGKWLPHRLTERNKAERVRIATELLDRYRRGDLQLDAILTGDEKWILYANIIRRRSWVDTGDIAPAVARAGGSGSFLFISPFTLASGLHPRKIMLSVWWDSEGIVYWEFLPTGNTINAQVYCEQLDRVAEALKENRPHREQITLLHDNARPHTANRTLEKLIELEWTVLPHPPYSPDLAPTDFKLFRSLQNGLRGKEFGTMEEISQFVTAFFASKPSGFFVRGFTDLPARWEETVENEGEYSPDD